MASKTIEGAFPAILTSQEEYETLLKRKNIQCLVNSKGHEIYGYAALVDGETYTAGPELAEAKGNALNVQQLRVELDKLERRQDKKDLKRVLAVLNPWAEGVGDARSEAPWFRDRVEKYYSTQACMLTGLSAKEVDWQRELTAAHLWPGKTPAFEIELLGLQPEDMTTGRNGLVLVSGVERAFDWLQVCFLPGQEQNQFIMRILDGKLANFDVVTYTGAQAYSQKSEAKYPFQNYDGKPLVFKNSNLPFRRILWLHAYCAIGTYA